MLPKRQLKHAVGAGVVVTVGVLGATHAPDHGAGTVVRHSPGNTLELGARHAGDPLGSSGVHLATSVRIWSMPHTRVRMNSLSSQPFSKMCHRIPQTRATSVPGRKRTYSSAWAAVRVKRGSQTISGALFCSFAFRTCCSETGCASAGLPPMMKIAVELWISL